MVPGASDNGVFGGAEYTKQASRLHQANDFPKKPFLRVFGGAAAEYTSVYSVGSPCIQRLSPCIRRPSTCIRRDLGGQDGVFGRKTVYSAGLVYSAKTFKIHTNDNHFAWCIQRLAWQKQMQQKIK